MTLLDQDLDQLRKARLLKLSEATGLQRRASDPEASVWVNASAGTGKTKVLTDRVLTLMLHGTPPERLLCLTSPRLPPRRCATAWPRCCRTGRHAPKRSWRIASSTYSAAAGRGKVPASPLSCSPGFWIRRAA